MDKEVYTVWKVGLFVVLGLVVTAAIVLAVRDWRWLRSGYEIRVLFDSVGGLLVGAPVKFAGVQVGEVASIRIVREGASATPVELRLWLPQEVEIREDDRVLIGMLGLLGEKYVEILPGAGKGRSLQGGDALVGAGTVSELELAQRFTHVLAQLEEALSSANALLTDPRISQRFESTLEQAERLTRRLDQTTQQAEELIRQWQSLGAKGSSFMDDVRQWAVVMALGAALFVLLLSQYM
jgi:phospholipid/cholesterol/gamma-HCH transport system substrate-binding protein